MRARPRILPICGVLSVISLLRIVNAVDSVTSLTPVFSQATGGGNLIVTGDFTLVGVVYLCHFGVLNTQLQATSLDATVITATRLQCTIPQWDFYGSANVKMWVTADGNLLANQQDFAFLENWVSATPAIAKAAASEDITITGAGFDVTVPYRCRWTSQGNNLVTAYQEVLPQAYDTIVCATPLPTWQTLGFSPDLTDIVLDILHVDATKPLGYFYVPYTGDPFFFSFAGAELVWSSLVITSSAGGEGRGVQGGDVVTYTSAGFGIIDPLKLTCVFTVDPVIVSTVTALVNGETATCATPALQVERAVELQLLYDTSFACEPAAGATSSVYGLTYAAVDPFTFPLTAVWTGLQISAFPLTGGGTVVVTGIGFDPVLIVYRCVWSGSQGTVIRSNATGVTATSMQCTTPNVNAVAAQAYTFSIDHGLDDSNLITTVAPADTMFSASAVWLSKSPDDGTASGGDVVTVVGLGFTPGAAGYECVFADTIFMPAVASTTAALTCLTPTDYGLTSPAGSVSFAIRSTTIGITVSIPFAGTAEEGVSDQSFTFVERWQSLAPTVGYAYSPGIQSVVVNGQGFSSVSTYYCAFQAPDCNSTAIDSTVSIWNAPVDSSCYILSEPAAVLSTQSLRCLVPAWPFTAGSVVVTLLGWTRTGAMFELDHPAGVTTFRFYRAVSAVQPLGAPLEGGLSVEAAVYGLDATATDYLLKWSTGAWTSYSEIVAQVTPCSASITALPSTAGATCLSGTTPTWPFEAGLQGQLSVVKMSDSGDEIAPSTGGSVAYNFSPLTDAFVWSTGVLELVGPSLANISRLVSVTDIRYWLSEVTDRPVWACQVWNITDAAAVSSSTRARKRGLGYSVLQNRKTASTDTTLVSYAVAGPVTSTASGGSYETAQSAGFQANTAIANGAPTAVLPSLVDLTSVRQTESDVQLAAASCPLGYGLALSSPTTTVCTLCMVGQYGSGVGTCMPCPEGGVCDTSGTAVPPVAVGYWRSPVAVASASFDFDTYGYHRCPGGAASCIGGTLSECANGHIYGEPLCDQCANNFYASSSGGSCSACKNTSLVRARVSIVFIFLLGAALLWLVYHLHTAHLTLSSARIVEPLLGLATSGDGSPTAKEFSHQWWEDDDECSSPGSGSVNTTQQNYASGQQVGMKTGEPTPTTGRVSLAQALRDKDREEALKEAAQADTPRLVVQQGSQQGGSMSLAQALMERDQNAAKAKEEAEVTAASVAAAAVDGKMQRQNSSRSARYTSASPNSWAQRMNSDDASILSPAFDLDSPFPVTEGQPSHSPGPEIWVQPGGGTDATMSLFDSVQAGTDKIMTVLLRPAPPVQLTQEMSMRITNEADAKRSWRTKALITIAHLHTLSALAYGQVYWIRWPQNFASLLATLQPIDLAVLTIPGLSLTCLNHGINFYDEWILAVSFLPCVAALLALCWFCGHKAINWAASKEAKAGRPAPATRRLQTLRFTPKCVQAFLWCALIFYPGICRKVFQLFDCTDIDGTYRLRAEPSISCDTSTYNVYMGFNIIALIVYPVGIPLCVLYLLIRCRIAQTKEQWVSSAMVVSFIATPFTQNLWYWLVCDLLRRILVTSIMLYILPGTGAQLIIGSLLAVAALGVHMFMHPFISSIDNTLHSAGLVCIAISTICGAYEQQSTWNALQDHNGGADVGDHSPSSSVALAVNVLWLAVFLPIACLLEIPAVAHGAKSMYDYIRGPFVVQENAYPDRDKPLTSVASEHMMVQKNRSSQESVSSSSNTGSGELALINLGLATEGLAPTRPVSAISPFLAPEDSDSSWTWEETPGGRIRKASPPPTIIRRMRELSTDESLSASVTTGTTATGGEDGDRPWIADPAIIRRNLSGSAQTLSQDQKSNSSQGAVQGFALAEVLSAVDQAASPSALAQQRNPSKGSFASTLLARGGSASSGGVFRDEGSPSLTGFEKALPTPPPLGLSRGSSSKSNRSRSKSRERDRKSAPASPSGGYEGSASD